MGFISFFVIPIQVVFDLLREMIFVLTLSITSLPRGFSAYCETTKTFREAMRCAMNQRWEERRIAEEFKFNPPRLESGGGALYWQVFWADVYKISLNLDEVERIFDQNRGRDEESGIPRWFVPLNHYAERMWRKQRPIHYRWSKAKQKVQFKLGM